MNRALVTCLCLLPLFAPADGARTTHAATGITVVEIPVNLPAEGWWYLAPTAPDPALGEAFLIAPEEAYDLAGGERARAIRLRKLQNERSSSLYTIQWRIRAHAEKNAGQGPARFGELDLGRRGDLADDFRGGVFHLVPDLPYPVPPSNAVPMVVEVKPLLDDGKHWVLDNSATGPRRVDIQPALLERLGIRVEPMVPDAKLPSHLPYSLLAQVRSADAERIAITVTNDQPRSLRRIELPLPETEGDPELFVRWAEERCLGWGYTQNRIGDMWLRVAPALYGVDAGTVQPLDVPFRRRGNTSSAMNVLGGEAALRETLQMENLELRNKGKAAEDMVPVSSIPGVTVKAHDYAALLGNTLSPGLALANLCPTNRLFVYAPDPAALLPLIDQGGGVLHRVFVNGSAHPTDQRILERHLARLGMNEDWLRQLLQSGMVGETALILPDLFLQEGTDLTVVARIKQAGPLRAALELLPASTGLRFHGDLVLLSSRADELAAVEALLAADGRGSLGASAEFRYMLTRCAPSDHTRVFGYLSDSFIRHLTGPQVKIGQLRRLAARAELERLSAGDLLYRADHARPPEGWQTLVERGYAPAPQSLDTNRLTWVGGVGTDPVWGSAQHMTTLLSAPVTLVSEAEKEAYNTYRSNYESYWRQFFDPIAINIEALSATEYQTTVFILPLIDSSIYEGIRTLIAPPEARRELRRPVFSPTPIAQLSANLSESAWVEVIEGLSDTFADALGLEFPIWDLLGPSVHLALADSDAIFTLGSGELLSLLSPAGLRSDEMFWFPILGSFLTRPVAIAVEVTDPEQARTLLQGMPTGTLANEGGWFGFDLSNVRITGEDHWLLRISLGGMVYLTLGIELQGDFLVLSNLPLTYQPRITRVDTAGLKHAALRLTPDACVATEPAFTASAYDRARLANEHTLSVLHHFHLAGLRSLDSALAACEARFGFIPLHPGSGQVVWGPAGPESSVFGQWGDARQPPMHQADPALRLLPNVRMLDVSMQLEDEGLRTQIRWKLEPKPAPGQP